MRICFLGDAGSIHLQRWVNYFIEAGYEVEVISFRPGPIEGATVHLLAQGKSSRYAYLQAIHKIRGLVRKIQPDILHAHYATSFGLLALISGFKPLVVSAWGSDVLVAPQRSMLMRVIVKLVLKHANALTSDSEYMSEKILELLNGQKQIIKTVTMGVSRQWFKQITDSAKKPFQILSLRGHQEIYNIDIIIRAMAEVVKKIPESKLVIAGEGLDTQNLKALVSSLNLDGNIQFVGQLPHSKVQSYLDESSVSVSVPSSDATAVSLLETMACGAFPIVSDLPANREWIIPEVNGLLVPSKDVHALAKALVLALEDSELRLKAKELNRQRIKDKAIWEDNMHEIEELYQHLISKKIVNRWS